MTETNVINNQKELRNVKLIQDKIRMQCPKVKVKIVDLESK